jgi:hypothetical protein
VSGEVKLAGRGTDLRVEVVLPDGERDWCILNDHGVMRDANGTVIGLSTEQVPNIQAFAFPLFQLARALSDATIGVSYLGVTIRNGVQVIGVRLVSPTTVYGRPNKRETRDFFFDGRSLQLSETEEFALATGRFAKGVRHQVRFSGYRQIQGVVLPFQILELLTDLSGEQPLAAITLDSVTFNAGHTDSTFRP